MFTGAHVILYSSDPEADRIFLHDVLGFRGVDAGEGWLIFKLPPAEVAVHPTVEHPKQELYLIVRQPRDTARRPGGQGRDDIPPSQGDDLGIVVLHPASQRC